MGTYRQILYHLVFATKFRAPVIDPQHENELHRYIGGVVRNLNGCLYAINGMADHLHILSDLHPSHSLSDFMRKIKVASSFWMKGSGKFPGFVGWQEGYGAFTCTIREKENVCHYIHNQKHHHKREDYLEEYKRLLQEHQVVFDERYLL